MPQGSTRAFVPKGWTRPIITSSAKGLAAWRRLVADVAQEHVPDGGPWTGPVSVELCFTLPRPKGERTERCDIQHPHKGPHHMVPVRTWPDRIPDLDKLVRAVFDALAQILFADDSQVVGLHACKDWGAPGVHVEVRRVTFEASS